MTVLGIPLHPLVVHAAVILVPAAGIIATTYAVVRRWRWLLRPLVPLSTVAAAVVVQVSVMSGRDLSKDFAGPALDRIATHMQWAERLQVAAWALAAIALVAWWLVPFASPLSGGRSPRAIGAERILTAVTLIALVVVGLATVVLAVLTGHAGADAVWGGA